MLLSYAWQNNFCFPDQERLAKDMGSGVRSVVRYIQELELHEFIKVKRQGQGRSNLYEINLTTKGKCAAKPEVPKWHSLNCQLGTARAAKSAH